MALKNPIYGAFLKRPQTLTNKDLKVLKEDMPGAEKLFREKIEALVNSYGYSKL